MTDNTIPATTRCNVGALAEECKRYINDLANWKGDDSETLHEAAWQSAIMTIDRLASAASLVAEPENLTNAARDDCDAWKWESAADEDVWTDAYCNDLARRFTLFNGSHAMTNYPALIREVLSLAAPQAPAALVAEPQPARQLAELVLHMEMVTEKGKRARELARQTLAGQDEALRHLLLIQHATAPSQDDGAYHENAHDLAMAGISALGMAAVGDDPAAPDRVLHDTNDFADSLCAMIGRISNALGISEEDQSFANGDAEILEAIEELKRAPKASVEQAAKYDDVLLPFLALMRAELHANATKGDRPGWLTMDRETAMLEVYHHAAKLAKALRNDDIPLTCEYAADVANMAMMVVDVCGALPIAAAPSAVPAQQAAVAAEVEGTRFPNVNGFERWYVENAFNLQRKAWHAALDTTQQVTDPAPARVEAVPVDEAVVKLARRLLWLAFCWNDHNFEDAHVLARREAESLGIKSFEQANEWLTKQDAAATPGAKGEAK